MTNTVIFMTLDDLRIRHTTAVPFSPLHIWIRILVIYVVKISRERWPEHPSGKTPDECVFIAYLCIHVNKVIYCIVVVYYVFLFPIDNLSAQVLKVDIYIPTYTGWRYIGRHHRHLFLVKKYIPRYYIYHKVSNLSFVKNLCHRDFRVFSSRRTPA
jgi:hypothetical protein